MTDKEKELQAEAIDYYRKQIAELNKENAELKVDNAFYERACEGAAMMYEHLTKAKEIIKKYMRFKPVVGGVQYYHEEYSKTEKEAEQFLNENSTYERIQKAKYNYTG